RISGPEAPEHDAETTLRLVRVFKADRRRVFRAFTDPAQLRVWVCPNGFHFVEIRVDPATARATDFVMQNSATGHQHSFRLEYELVDEPAQIRWVSIWLDGFENVGRRTNATMVFRDVPGGTELTLTHGNFPDARTRDEHGQGWASGLQKLAQLLAA